MKTIVFTCLVFCFVNSWSQSPLKTVEEGRLSGDLVLKENLIDPEISNKSGVVIFVTADEFENEDIHYSVDKEEVKSVNKRFEVEEPENLFKDENTYLNDEGYDLSEEK